MYNSANLVKQLNTYALYHIARLKKKKSFVIKVLNFFSSASYYNHLLSFKYTLFTFFYVTGLRVNRFFSMCADFFYEYYHYYAQCYCYYYVGTQSSV